MAISNNFSPDTAPDYSLHVFIDHLLNNKLSFTEEIWFTDHVILHQVEKADFRHYLPDLCDLLFNPASGSYGSFFTLLIILKISPLQPTVAEADKLISLLDVTRGEDHVSVYHLLEDLVLPEGTDTGKLMEFVKTPYYRYTVHALRVLDRVPHTDVEGLLLGELHKGRGRALYASTILEGLGYVGSIWAIPVMVAEFLEDSGHGCEEGSHWPAVVCAIERICDRHGFAEAIKSTWTKPASWRIVWEDSRESFVAFAMKMYWLMVGAENGYSETMVDRIGDILLREIDIDIRPFQSFRELRLCTDYDLVKSLRKDVEYLRNHLMILDLLDGANISENRECTPTELQEQLLKTYFVHRLRQYFKFADE